MKAVISGASRGIGKAVAEELAAKGYHLILIARGIKELENLSNILSKKYPKINVKLLAVDLSDHSERKSLTKRITISEPIDVLINNVGVFSKNNPDDIDYQALIQSLERNLFSAIELTQALLPSLKQCDESIIINIGSALSLTASSFSSDYSISKHALKAWNDALREKLRSEGIKVSAIYPGPVNTPSWGKGEKNLKKMIQAEDIAKLIGSILTMGKSSLVEEIKLNPLNL